MPLSEHEQRMLDEMERNLYGRDSDVHATPTGGLPRPHYPAIFLGVVLGLSGLAMILAGVMTHLIVLGIAGFVVVMAGVLIGTRPGKPREVSPDARSSRGSSRSSFAQRMAEKWDQREQ